MIDVKKIMCYCGCGLGTSLIMEMNVKNVLDELGIKGVEVIHSTVDDVVVGAADLFVCAADLQHVAEKIGKSVGIKNMLDVNEYKEKLKEALEI